jgi:hypothetical protein
LYQWTLSAEEAAAANQQSEQDYVKLLIRSGYMNLHQLLALLRHLSTEPHRSETVSGEVLVTRTPQTSSSVTVSTVVPLSEPITATATRTPQKCEGIAYISTQPIDRQVVVKYRIWLRTLAADPIRHADVPFDSYFSTTYVPDDDPDFLKLAVNAEKRWLLDEQLLYNDSPSPTQEVQKSSTTGQPIGLNAVTYDYYVPVRFSFPPLGLVKEGARARGAGLVGAGTVVGGPAGMLAQGATQRVAGQGLSGGDAGTGAGSGGAGVSAGDALRSTVVVSSSVGGVAGALGAQDATLPRGTQKREFQATKIHLQYRLSWNADQLSIAFDNVPADRNYTFYVVVEEHLPSGQWLQTPFRIDVVGQLTYVPQSFFDAEAAAEKKLVDILSSIERHYSISKQPKPGDPQSGVIRPGDLVSVPSLETVAQIAQKHSPEVLRKAVTEYDKAQQKAAKSAKTVGAGDD